MNSHSFVFPLLRKWPWKRAKRPTDRSNTTSQCSAIHLQCALWTSLIMIYFAWILHCKRSLFILSSWTAILFCQVRLCLHQRPRLLRHCTGHRVRLMSLRHAVFGGFQKRIFTSIFEILLVFLLPDCELPRNTITRPMPKCIKSDKICHSSTHFRKHSHPAAF